MSYHAIQIEGRRREQRRHLLEDQRVQVTKKPSALAYAGTVAAGFGAVGFGGYAGYAASQKSPDALVAGIAAGIFALIGMIGGWSIYRHRPQLINRNQLSDSHYVPVAYLREQEVPAPTDRAKLVEMLTAIADGRLDGVEDIPSDLSTLWQRVDGVVRAPRRDDRVALVEVAAASPASSGRGEALQAVLDELSEQVNALYRGLNIRSRFSDDVLMEAHSVLPQRDLGGDSALWNRIDLELRRRDHLLEIQARRRFEAEVLISYGTIVKALGQVCGQFGIDLASYTDTHGDQSEKAIQHRKVLSGLTRLSDAARRKLAEGLEASGQVDRLRKVEAEKGRIEADLERVKLESSSAAETLDQVSGERDRALELSRSQEERIGKLSHQLEEATAQAEAARDEAAAKAKSLKAVSAELSEIAGRSSATDGELKARISELEELLEAAEAEKASAESALRKLQASTAESGSSSEAAMRQLSERARVAEEKVRKMTAEISSLKSEMREQAEAHRRAFSSLERDLRGAEDRAARAEDTCARLRDERGQARDERDRADRSFRELDSQHRALDDEFRRLDAEFGRLKEDYGRVYPEWKKLRGEVAELRAQLAQIREMAENASRLVSGLGNELLGGEEIAIDRRDIPPALHPMYPVFSAIEGLKGRIELNKSRGYASDASSPFSSPVKPKGRHHRRRSSDSSDGSVGTPSPGGYYGASDGKKTGGGGDYY